MTAPAGLLVSRCTSCHNRFLPRRGPCPRCGATGVEPVEIPARATVLAATELTVPPPGWSRPHRLALLEAVDAVRLIAVVDGPLPATGDVMSVTRDGEIYRVSPMTAPGASPGASAAGRGEGDAPGAGVDPAPL